MKPYLQLAEDASKEDDEMVRALIRMGILVEAYLPSESSLGLTPEGNAIAQWRLFTPKEDEIDPIEKALGFQSLYKGMNKSAPSRLPPGTYDLYPV
jgi:hypothetical protein